MFIELDHCSEVSCSACAEKPCADDTKSKRADILDSAKECVCHDRADQYGGLENNFAAIADLWSAYLDVATAGGITISLTDVANMMILLKVARGVSNPGHRDNWVDIAGYAACGGELAADT